MENLESQQSLILKFEGRLADEGGVPVRVLTQTLDAMQRAIYVLALEQENVESRLRERVSRDMETRYALICSPPKPGSYLMEAWVGDPQSDLFVPESAHAVTERFQEACRIFVENIKDFGRLIPDRARRMRLFEAFRQMLPREGSGIHLSIGRNSESSFFSSRAIDRSELSASRVETPEEEPMAVTGKLTKIDFNAREFTLEYPVNRRSLKCHYDDAVEDLLLESPRDLIQVIGTVIRDENDFPQEIRDVENIRQVDLSPFFVREFRWDGLVLKPAKTSEFTFRPELDESSQLMCIVREELGLDVHAYTREELDEEMNAQMAFLWTTYAQGPPERMTERARQLRARLLDLLTEVPIGAAR